MKRGSRRVRRVKLKALFTEPFTYNIFQNRYIWFGFLAGLPIPLICMWPHFSMCMANPLHWLHLTVPLILAFIFGCFGTFMILKEVEVDTYKTLYHIKAKGVKI